VLNNHFLEIQEITASKSKVLLKFQRMNSMLMRIITFLVKLQKKILEHRFKAVGRILGYTIRSNLIQTEYLLREIWLKRPKRQRRVLHRWSSLKWRHSFSCNKCKGQTCRKASLLNHHMIITTSRFCRKKLGKMSMKGQNLKSRRDKKLKALKLMVHHREPAKMTHQ
jgi:hypothetical protein